jgi:peptidoglycan/LPS O-acetylase OafA/YrhL
MDAPALAVRYFVLQAIAVLLWWGALAVHAPWRAYFRATDAADASLLAFAAPDLLLLVIGSAAVAFGRARGRRWTAPLASVVAGASLYATVYVATLWLMRVASPLGAVLMAPSTVLSAWAALVLNRDATRHLSSGRPGDHAAQPGEDGAAVQRHLGADARRAPAGDPPA